MIKSKHFITTINYDELFIYYICFFSYYLTVLVKISTIMKGLLQQFITLNNRLLKFALINRLIKHNVNN